MTESQHGQLNGHAAGIILKELVRRAIVTIRNERTIFDVSEKEAYSGGMTDVCTSADRKAQAVYLRSLRECFPDYGIIAEEEELSIPPKGSAPGYFTVDPLDGTKAFVRRQSHGVGTMIALVEHGRVVSAYIGDVNTQEIYGFRPGSPRVHRITGYETAEELTYQQRPLSEQYVLLRDPERTYSEASRRLLSRFKSWEIEGGSIGIWLARLWKREVAAALLPPSHETPWDMAPVLGISQTLGYVFHRPTGNCGWEAFEPAAGTTICQREHDLLLIHREDIPALGDLTRPDDLFLCRCLDT